MKKIYHLQTCSTCQRILKELNLEGIVLQDIKTEKITPEQLDEMHQLAGSYEALFSRKAMKFRALNLHNETLDEDTYRTLILDEYTFLKRPVALINGSIFIGNSKQNVAALQQAL